MEERTKDPGVAIVWPASAAARCVHRSVAHGGTGSLTLTGQLGECEGVGEGRAVLDSPARKDTGRTGFFKKPRCTCTCPRSDPQDGPSAGARWFRRHGVGAYRRSVRGYIAMTGRSPCPAAPADGGARKRYAPPTGRHRENFCRSKRQNVNENLTPDLGGNDVHLCRRSTLCCAWRSTCLDDCGRCRRRHGPIGQVAAPRNCSSIRPDSDRYRLTVSHQQYRCLARLLASRLAGPRMSSSQPATWDELAPCLPPEYLSRMRDGSMTAEQLAQLGSRGRPSRRRFSNDGRWTVQAARVCMRLRTNQHVGN